METVEVLTRALEIISDPERWTQHTFAKAANGANISYLNPKAIRFCASGAIFKCVEWDGRFPVPAFQYLDKAALQMVNSNPVGVNDKLGHAAVIRMFERSIELARAEVTEEVMTSESVSSTRTSQDRNDTRIWEVAGEHGAADETSAVQPEEELVTV